MSQILNVAPIIYDEASIIIEKIPYSDELFDQLRQSLTTHLVKRRDNSILLVPLTTKSPSYGGERQLVNLKEDLSIVSSLARDSIFRMLMSRNVHISELNPIKYMVVGSGKNILDGCLPPNVKPINGLCVFARWEIDFRVIAPNGQSPFVSISLNISTAPRINLSCQSLISSGFPFTGYYVGISRVKRNKELKPHFYTIGKVTRILDNGMLELDDVREGHSSCVDPIDVFLEPREDILENCIRHFYKADAEQILRNLEFVAGSFHRGDQKLRKLNEGLRVLQQSNLTLAGVIPFKIGDFLTDNPQQARSLQIGIAEKPTFVYSYGGSQHSQYNDIGLMRYGPYSKESFSPAKPRICVICQDRKKGQVELVLQKFLNGMPPVSYGKGDRTFEYTGLKTKYYLQDCILEFFGSSDDTVDGYNRAITAAMQAGSMGQNWNLALVQIDGSFRLRTRDHNPYLTSKARFVGQGIPVQEFTLEALGLSDQKVVWSINNMSLATYAKLGGVPWLLAADRPIAHELVFGIGSSVAQDSRLGGKERMVGITTVFTGDGNYFINNISAAVPADQYFQTLLVNLRATMVRVQSAYNWQPHDTVRLIFHAFKTFKNAEADVVKQVVSELGDYNVEFAFVHVAESHPYLIFDVGQYGLGSSKKGIFAPDRGKYLQLSEHTSLVSLTGPQELKKSSDGLPAPLQLILHKDSTFKDLTYLSKQVLKFGAHSWRSFTPASMPVSVYYSQLMAQMLSQLNGVSQWSSDALYNKIGTTRWFL
ncbi:argonaute/piwi family protein [Taibaiella koreensis]|uniref:argonaute/piwi family protein n=1 Tax=Taibaiella koreensis TaxID=1268548 RepID=UPI000E5A03B0|nr:Piwi domain-containing protein [Taibaiella koreensis]